MFPYFFPTFYGDLGPNKAYKTSTEIFYTTCRKLRHLEKYSTLFVENCDRPTDGPTKLGTEAPSPELKKLEHLYFSNMLRKILFLGRGGF